MKTALHVLLLLVIAPALVADTLSFKVAGIDCAACAPPVIKALQSVAGVKNAKVDTNTKVATVDVPANFDRERIRVALSNAGFEPQFAGDKGSQFQPLPAAVVKTLDIVEYKGDRRIEPAKIVATGKVTIIDFYGDWCGPCHVLEARLQRLMVGKKNLAVRRVNIGHWDNAAAKQATREFRAEALPYIRVYDARGNYVTSVTGGMWDEVLGAIEKAERR